MRAQRSAMHSAESEATTTRPKTSYTQRCRWVISVEIFSRQGTLTSDLRAFQESVTLIIGMEGTDLNWSKRRSSFIISWLIFGLGNRGSQVLGNTNIGEAGMPVEIVKYITRVTLETCHCRMHLTHGQISFQPAPNRAY